MNTALDISSALPHLSPEELARVRDEAAVLLAIGPKGKAQAANDAPAEDDFAQALYAALADELKRRTQVSSMPFATFARGAQCQNQFGPAARLAAHANATWFPKQTKTERASMLRLYAKLSLDYLAAQSRPAVWYNISAAIAALPQVVDGAFPGYAAAGLLGKVQALRTRGVRPTV